jgi:hypothetical protein
VPEPFGSLHSQPPCTQFDVAPLERDDLAEPQAGITAQQHHQARLGIALSREERLDGADANRKMDRDGPSQS